MSSRPETGAGEHGAAAPRRLLLALIVPIVGAGGAAAAVAAWALAGSEPAGTTLRGIALMLGAAALAEAYPVQIESLPAGNVSLAAVFVVSAGLVYGWQAAALIGVCAGV